MQSKITLSLAIPVYNGADKLKKQFKRIFSECDNKKFKNFLEVLISDNASTDDTRKVVSYFKKKSNKKKNIKITYYRKKKNEGVLKNIIGLSKLVKGKYILFSSDDDLPSKGYYNEIYSEIYNKNFKEMCIAPIHNSRKYYHGLFGKNIISYVVSRGSIFSGIILNTKYIKYKSYLKTVYPQVELFLDYYINHGMKDLSMNSTINNIDSQKSHEKFDDRVQRGKDYAFLGRINILEKFLKKNKIDFFQFFIAFYHQYKWGLQIKFILRQEKAFKLENIFYREIIKIERKKLLTLIIFLIFVKNFFSKKMFFYLEAFKIKLLN